MISAGLDPIGDKQPELFIQFGVSNGNTSSSLPDVGVRKNAWRSDELEIEITIRIASPGNPQKYECSCASYL